MTKVNTQKTMEKTVKFILSNTYISGFYKIIDEIAEKVKNNKFENIILVVPDKFSLNAEQIFMERTGLSSVFNVWLTTLSRLINKIVADDGKPFAVLTKNSGTMLVSQIIAKNVDKIKTYKKITNNYALAETMFNVINLLKSSGVQPEELKHNFNNTNLGLKLEDIYLVYSEYEKALKGKADTITRLQIFDEKIKNSEYIKNSHIYFTMFESFTNVQQNSLAGIAKQAKSFTISLCANTHQSNYHIFDNSVFARLKSTFEDERIKLTIQNTLQEGTNQQKFLSKNLFAFDVKNKLETNSIKLLECSNADDEVRYVASKIKFLVMQKKYDFDDINVAVNGLEDYKLSLQKIFDEFDFPYYLDTQRKLTEHFFVKSIFKIADFVCGQKTQSNAISIVDSPLFEIDIQKKDDFKNFCSKYNIMGDEFYYPFDFEDSEQTKNAEFVRKIVFVEILNFENILKDCLTMGEIKIALIEYLTKINANHVLKNISEKNMDLVQKQINDEVFEKFLHSLDECDELLKEDEMTGKFFFEMLKSCLSSVNLLTVPLKCGAVFVGDVSQSTYYPKKVLFCVGSAQGRMPLETGDFGTITDSEITVFKSTNRISPTIKEINKREKFKIFNLICLPSDRLELTFSNLIFGEVCQKSEFVRAIQNICLTNGMPIKIEKFEEEELKIFNDTDEYKPAYLIGTEKNALKISKSKSNNLKYILKNNFDSLLKEKEKIFLETAKRFDINNSRELLFSQNKTKVSQIEKYFNCPFLQFIDYGISPKENPQFSLRSVDVGNILHKIAQIFVDDYIKNGFVFADDISANVEKIFNSVISFDEYKNFAKNTYSLKSLKAEAVRFCEAIKHQVLCSDYVPKFTEKKFSNFLLKNNITISGIVDRIDICDAINSVRIVDYKTGKDKFSFENVYYGIKLQLIVYMQIIADILDKKPVATMYMPVKNIFGNIFDDEFKNYKLDGIILDNDGVIKRLDKSLIDKNKSDVVDVEYKTSGELTENSKKFLLSKDEFENLCKYAFECLNGAIDEMLDGYIMPKPEKTGNYSPCDRCKYKSMCHYDIAKLGYREIKSKTKKDF